MVALTMLMPVSTSTIGLPSIVPVTNCTPAEDAILPILDRRQQDLPLRLVGAQDRGAPGIRLGRCRDRHDGEEAEGHSANGFEKHGAPSRAI